MKQKNIDSIYIMLSWQFLKEIIWGVMPDSNFNIYIAIRTIAINCSRCGSGFNSRCYIAKLVTRNSWRLLELVVVFQIIFSSQTPSQTAASKFHNQQLSPEVASLLTKTELEVAIDKVFTNSANLSGESIVQFVRALSEVAQEEIDSSGQSTNPRTYSLQKLWIFVTTT